MQKIKSIANIKCVLGNHEKYLIKGIKKPYPDGMDESERLHHEWEHSLLSEDNRYINFKPNPDISDCEKMFSNINADIILYGHDHRGGY